MKIFSEESIAVYFKAHFGEEQKYSRYPIAAMI
jgi:hypothetical protein